MASPCEFALGVCRSRRWEAGDKHEGGGGHAGQPTECALRKRSRSLSAAHRMGERKLFPHCGDSLLSRWHESPMEAARNYLKGEQFGARPMINWRPQPNGLSQVSFMASRARSNGADAARNQSAASRRIIHARTLTARARMAPLFEERSRISISSPSPIPMPFMMMMMMMEMNRWLRSPSSGREQEQRSPPGRLSIVAGAAMMSCKAHRRRFAAMAETQPRLKLAFPGRRARERDRPAHVC